MSDRRPRLDGSWGALWPLALIPLAIVLTLAGLFVLAANVVSFHPFEAAPLPAPPPASEFGTARHVARCWRISSTIRATL